MTCPRFFQGAAADRFWHTLAVTGEREQEPQAPARNAETDAEAEQPETGREARAHEIGGPKGLEPTRYGDWERAGRCVDF